MESIENHLDNYEIFESVGSGSFGMVYRGKSRLDNQDVAIKSFTLGNNLFKNYLNELRFVFTLLHPNIVKVIDVYSIGIYHYIIYEYMNAGSLRDLINDKKVTKVKDVTIIISSILLALDHVHKSNVAHRDVKPENILISQKDGILTYKLADFGISKISNNNSDLTTNVGSPAYMSPEQFKALYDKRSDIYSLGIIFYELLYAERPFSGSLSDIMNGHLYSEPDFGTFDIELVNILKKMLEKDPSSRYQNSLDIINDLSKINIKDDDTKISNISLFNINLPTDYNQVENISTKEEKSYRSLGTHVNFFENINRNQTIVISNKNAFVYSNKLDIESYIDKKNIQYVFKNNDGVNLITNNSIFKLKKVAEVFEQNKIFDLEKNSKNFYNSSLQNTLIYHDLDNKVYLYNYAIQESIFSFESGLKSISQILLKDDYIYIISDDLSKYNLSIYSLEGIKLSKTRIDNFIQLSYDEKYIYAICYDQSECKIYKFFEKSHEIYCFNFYHLKSVDIIDNKIFIVNNENIIFLIEKEIIYIGKNINIGEIVKFVVLENKKDFLFFYKLNNSLKLTIVDYDTIFD